MEQFSLEPVESFELAELTDIEIDAVAGGATAAASTGTYVAALGVGGFSFKYGNLTITASEASLAIGASRPILGVA